MAKPKKSSDKVVAHFQHEGEKRKNIPTAELQSLQSPGVAEPKELRYPRNPDLDPQLVWRGKDQQDWSDLVVPTPPLYIQEKVHPKALIDDLLRRSKARQADEQGLFGDLFQDFDGLPKDVDKTEFYQHDSNWSNRMILGDSLQVMASLAEREGLRGKVQCVYFDPPYGIEFNSNFQWSTATREVKDGNAQHITREPEQVKAFRDTWKDGIHSYLTYLRDRLVVARDLLTDSGSIFVQIGDENVHRVRAIMDEVFGPENAGDLLLVKKKGGQKGRFPEAVNDYIVWFFKNKNNAKVKQLYEDFADESEVARDFRLVRLPSGAVTTLSEMAKSEDNASLLLAKPLLLERERGCSLFKSENATSGGFRKNQSLVFEYNGRKFDPGIKKNNCWKHTANDKPGEFSGMRRLACADRLYVGKDQIGLARFFSDFGLQPISNWWDGFGGAHDPIYVVQTNVRIVERCLLLATDPGDIVLDPTCGSGTTAVVAEQWGRRWITIDTSRVALALARARIMGEKFPYYLLADSREGQLKEAEITRSGPSSQPTYGKIRHGFVNQRRAHVTSSVVANNAEIDVIWDRWQKVLGPILAELNKALNKSWEEWEIPRDVEHDWSSEARKAHTDWWKGRVDRQEEIDVSIAAKAEFEYLYDKPYEDKKKVRVAGPFTVESLTPYRTLAVDADGDAVDLTAKSLGFTAKKNFAELILENLRSAGVQQAHKEDKIVFSSLKPWAGKLICAEGHYQEGDTTRRAAIFIGPEFGTIDRPDLVEAAREAADAKFDALIACAFSYSATTTDLTKLGPLTVLKARMNADLHMAEDLKSTGKGNLFVIFGEPDIDLITEADGQLRVKIKGVDVFKPQLGKVESSNTDEIACWFIDTDYNEESFFVRHAYFLGANDPYDSLKKTLKAEIDKEAWESLHSDLSRPFAKPHGKRIAVKVINHLGDEVMRVFKVD